MEKTNEGRTLIVSYNQIEGIPEGRFEDDKIVVFSARTGGKLDEKGRWIGDGLVESEDKYKVARKALDQLVIQACETTNSENIAGAVIYVGSRARDEALNIAKFFSLAGKKVRIVGCDCGLDEKKAVADAIGTKYEVCECGGVKTMGKIAKEYQRLGGARK